MEKRSGLWFLIEFDGSRSALCRAMGHKDLDPDSRRAILTAKHKMEVAEIYDLFAIMRPIPLTNASGQIMMSPSGQPMTGIGRESVTTGNHFLLEPCPCYVNMEIVSKVTFLDDMKPFDQDHYDAFIESAKDNLKMQRKANSPIVEAGDAPKGMRIPVSPDGKMDLSKILGG